MKLISLLLPVLAASCAQIPESELSTPQGIGSTPDEGKRATGVFFFEGFDDEGYRERFVRGDRAKNLSLVTGDVVFNGESSLKISMPSGHGNGVGMSYRFTANNQTEPSELYARYYLRFDKSWNAIGSRGKLPGPAGRYNRGGWGGRTSDGFNGWSARVTTSRSSFGPDYIDLGYYAYHALMPRKYGELLMWVRGNRGTLEKDRWYCIETYVKMNDVGKQNGVLRAWVDGHLAMEQKGMVFRKSPDILIQEFWFNIHNNKTENDMHMYVDNLILSSQPIGTALVRGAEP